MKTVEFEDQAITPSKIVCVGRNYAAHIEELNNAVPDEPVFFLKPNSAISDRLCAIHGEALHYEAELCFLWLQGTFSAVAAGLDLTKRGLQSTLKARGLPWERAKAFDGSALFSPFVAIDSIDSGLGIELRIDGEIRQSGTVELMLNSLSDIQRSLADFMTLEDGDILMTGTPKGVGKVESGAIFSVRVFEGERTLTQADWVASA